MKAVAKAKMIRVSPRKIALVAALIRQKSAAEASLVLAGTNKSAADIVGKVLDAAVANAENNLNLKRADLMVESVLVGAGATLKRIRPRSRGQVNRIMKRTSHITIILSDAKVRAEVSKSVQSKTEATGVATTEADLTKAKQPSATKTAPAKSTKEKQ